MILSDAINDIMENHVNKCTSEGQKNYEEFLEILDRAYKRLNTYIFEAIEDQEHSKAFLISNKQE